MAFPAVMNAVTGAVGPQDMGKAAGINSMLRELGGVFGIAICVAVFAGAGSYVSPQAFTDGFAPALATSAGLALLGAAIALLVPARAATAPAVVRPRGAPGLREHLVGPHARGEVIGVGRDDHLVGPGARDQGLQLGPRRARGRRRSPR